MTRLLIKNSRCHYLIIMFALVITFVMLIKIEHLEALDALRLLFAGSGFSKMFLAFAFVICMVLLQYLNMDSIMLLLKNNSLLIIRQKNHDKLLLMLFKNIIILNLIFITLIIISFLFALLICNRQIVEVMEPELLELSIRGFVVCLCFSMIQIYLAMKYDESNVFMMMTLVSVIGIFISKVNLGIFTIFPIQLSPSMLGLNITVCSIYICIGVMICKRTYDKLDKIR